MTLPTTVCTLNLFSIVLPAVPILHPSTSIFLSPMNDSLRRLVADEGQLKHRVCDEPRHLAKSFTFLSTSYKHTFHVLHSLVSLYIHSFSSASFCVTFRPVGVAPSILMHFFSCFFFNYYIWHICHNFSICGYPSIL